MTLYLSIYTKDCLYHLFIPIKALSEIQVCHIITFHMITDRKYEILDKNCQF